MKKTSNIPLYLCHKTDYECVQKSNRQLVSTSWKENHADLVTLRQNIQNNWFQEVWFCSADTNRQSLNEDAQLWNWLNFWLINFKICKNLLPYMKCKEQKVQVTHWKLFVNSLTVNLFFKIKKLNTMIMNK